MQLHDITALLEEIAPLELADESDSGKIGLVLDRGNNVNMAAVALDPTDYVLEEAARLGADLLITHHALIYEPVCRLSKQLSDSLKIALENEISIYVMHTNYDRAEGGVNDALVEALNLTDVTRLPSGCVGDIEGTALPDFAAYASQRLNTHVQFTGTGTIKRVMVLGGSGFRKEYIDIALDAGADALLSGDLRHDAIRYAGHLALVDATHYATECPAMRRLCERLPVDSVFIEHDPGIRNL
ncbi:MAG TPA: Nif3-like dinuclear metal center hexameric protein [Candidatus Methanoperedenaceae archaeon]|nr:Nif3-like dinuclear metal center hexameric protein [Candidatus Methanoperedenaceae archaeon]